MIRIDGCEKKNTGHKFDPGQIFGDFIMWSDAPRDVFDNVYDFLDLRDAVRLASTCRAARHAFADRPIVAKLGRGTPRSVARFLLAHSDRVEKIRSYGRGASAAVSPLAAAFGRIAHLHLSNAQIPDSLTDDIANLDRLQTLYVRKFVPSGKGINAFRTSWLDSPRSLKHVKLYASGAYDEIIFDHEKRFASFHVESPKTIEVVGSPPSPSSVLSLTAFEISTDDGFVGLAPTTRLRSKSHVRRNPALSIDEETLGNVRNLTYACRKHPCVPDLARMTSLESLTFEADSGHFRLSDFEGLKSLRKLVVKTKGWVAVGGPGDFRGFERGKTEVVATAARDVDVSDEFYAPLPFNGEDFE